MGVEWDFQIARYELGNLIRRAAILVSRAQSCNKRAANLKSVGRMAVAASRPSAARSSAGFAVAESSESAECPSAGMVVAESSELAERSSADAEYRNAECSSVGTAVAESSESAGRSSVDAEKRKGRCTCGTVAISACFRPFMDVMFGRGIQEISEGTRQCQTKTLERATGLLREPRQDSTLTPSHLSSHPVDCVNRRVEEVLGPAFQVDVV